MARKLLTFRHSETTYNRPNQTWTCGRECEGVTCALGPDSHGRCRARFVIEGKHPRRAGECIPARGEYNKFTGETSNSDRWFCTREAARGGPCHHGPLPDGSCCRPVAICRPEASLRRKRGTFAVCVVGLTLATILIFFARKPETLNHPLNPGPISATHSTAGITCADCHSEPALTLSALSGFHSSAFDDGILCLKCHGEIGSPGDEKAFAAHTLPADHLDLLTQKAAATRAGGPIPIGLQLANVMAKDYHRIACATCHQEHHGKDVDLTALSNHQCQVCHTGQFHSFSRGHPEFTSYPYRRKTRIFFDHNKHFSEYFNNVDVRKFSPKACSQCHSENADGRMMATGSYEKTCADCHHADPLFDQWEILAFPKVDTDNLAAHLSEADRKKLDEWKSATARTLHPLIKILLDSETGEGAETLADALKTLRASEDGLQLRRFRNASDEHRKAGAIIASAILNKIYGDDEGFRDRLSQSKWLEGAASGDRNRLGKNLADVFLQLRSRSNESAGDAGDGLQSIASTTDFGGVFSYDRSSGSITYEPGGHADPFLKAALDATAAKVSKIQAAEELFSTVSNYLSGFDSTAAGKCLKCHTVDQQEDGTFVVNWNPAGLETGTRPITHFKHRSHVRLPELVRSNAMATDESCASCHALAQSAEQLKKYRAFFSGANLNPHRFQSGFKDLSLNSCTSCHSQTKAGNQCLLCHQYHATPSPLEPNFTDLLTGIMNADTAAPDADTKSTEIESDDGDSLIPDDGDSLIPDDGDSLIPDDGDSLIPDDSDSLIPDDGDSLIPDDGDSLIPDDGDSLIPDDGDSLISDDGDSLIPEEDSESEP